MPTYYRCEIIRALREPKTTEEIVSPARSQAVQKVGAKGFIIEKIPAVTAQVTRHDEVTRVDVLGTCYQQIGDDGVLTGYFDEHGTKIPVPSEARVLDGPHESAPWEAR